MMDTFRQFLCLIPFFLFFFITTGCDISDQNEPEIIEAGHGGWKNQSCDLCHELPVEGHDASDPPECAACHGGNGACDPNADSSLRDHDATTDDCIVCHQDNHGFDHVS